MAGNTSQPGTSVASRVLGLLGAFDDECRSLTLSELARRADVPVPTAHRLLGELVAWGALVRRPSGEYVVGRRMWHLGCWPRCIGASPDRLAVSARPLRRDAGHRAPRRARRLEVLYVDRLSGHASVRVVSQVGSRLPLHATGVGKVLLAFAPEDVQKQALGNLTRHTAYTVTQPGRLLGQLRRVHRDGFAQTIEEMSLGACSVAVPIWTPDGRVVASVGVVVRSLRRDRAKLVAALQVAAHGIGRGLPG